MKCYASMSNRKNDYVGVSVGELVYAIQNDMEQDGYDRADTELYPPCRIGSITEA